VSDEGPQGRREIRDLLARHGVSPRKRLGQHFLADPNIVRKIVAMAGVGPGDRVLEIGAGTGTLTRALAGTGARVVAYEVDPALGPVLEEATAGVEGVELRLRDAMGEPFAEVLEGSGWVLAANLPYNVGTPLLLDLLQHVPQIVRFVVMVQKEVADRLAAPPGSRTYGLPSVVAALYAIPGERFPVSRRVFIPPPAVDSVAMLLFRRPPADVAARAVVLAAAAFGQRRKMLRSSLAAAVADPAALLDAAGIAATARAEELAPDDYVRLAQHAG
jgi:16S rRNA (adenine1518-N6/adenine1519-N6)-dimethyltransferase